MALLRVDRNTPRPPRRWAGEAIERLRAEYGTTETRELAFKLGISYGRVRSMAKNERLLKAVPRMRWTPEADALLTARYADENTAVLASELGATVSKVLRRAHQLGLHKSIEFIRALGTKSQQHPNTVAARWKKGMVPPNKGKAMPAELYAKCAPTMFKSGALNGRAAQLHVPIGTEVLSPDGYLKRKVSDDRTRPSRFNWKFVHVLMWEEKNGPVPEKHMVTFRDGNKANLVYENLQLLSMGENARRNKARSLKKRKVDTTYQLH